MTDEQLLAIEQILALADLHAEEWQAVKDLLDEIKRQRETIRQLVIAGSAISAKLQQAQPGSFGDS